MAYFGVFRRGSYCYCVVPHGFTQFLTIIGMALGKTELYGVFCTRRWEKLSCMAYFLLGLVSMEYNHIYFTRMDRPRNLSVFYAIKLDLNTP